MKIACIGVGARGTGYLTLMRTFRKSQVEVSALCDINKSTLADNAKRYGVASDMTFFDEDSFFAAGKLADALIIATQDESHVRIATKALQTGYKYILLEKPISKDYEACVELSKLANELSAKIVVCHVLRYATYYKKIMNVIRSGEIGDIVSINHTENVGYFHFAHSFVRGDWKSEEASAPSLLAKCCHDIDLLYWFMGKPAKSVSSLGKVNYFSPENAPKGAAERCLDCKVKKTCPYDAEAFYITDPFWKAKWIKYMSRKITLKNNNSKDEIRQALKSTSDYGRCVWKSGNDVCDNQTVQIDFGNGQTAVHTMTAFSEKCFRETHIMGTKGELIGRGNALKLLVFGKYKKTLSRKFQLIPGHGEGDLRTAIGFVDLVTGKLENTDDVTFIEASLPSHLIVDAAERSRKENGKLIEL